MHIHTSMHTYIHIHSYTDMHINTYAIYIYIRKIHVYILHFCNSKNNNISNNLNDDQLKQAFLDIYRRHQI